ncbi:MAG TPA: hypothetical protein VHB48_01020 [Chitinophagaceae bacterium]|jgi:hypothetical protein|nr:hypothetical protein [Chitinophagaceae bacterium]
MSLQPLTIAPNKNLPQKQAVKILGLCVAGFLIVAMLLFNPFKKNSTPAQSLSASKQASLSGSNGGSQKVQCSSSPTFSLMPGRLNRFLQ